MFFPLQNIFFLAKCSFAYKLLFPLFNLFTVSYAIGLMIRVFANGPGDLGSIPGHVIPKTQKMVLDTTLFSTQHYMVRIKGKVEQSWEWSSTPPHTPRRSSYWKGSLWIALDKSHQLYLLCYLCLSIFSTKFLILSIWPWTSSNYSFRYVLVSFIWAFSSFWA